MGGLTTAHFNAFQKERLGWLNYGASPPIITATQTNNYWIDAYEANTNSAKAVKVLKSTDASGYRTWYYVENRARFGFDGITAGEGDSRLLLTPTTTDGGQGGAAYGRVAEHPEGLGCQLGCQFASVWAVLSPREPGRRCPILL